MLEPIKHNCVLQREKEVKDVIEKVRCCSCFCPFFSFINVCIISGAIAKMLTEQKKREKTTNDKGNAPQLTHKHIEHHQPDQ